MVESTEACPVRIRTSNGQACQPFRFLRQNVAAVLTLPSLLSITVMD